MAKYYPLTLLPTTWTLVQEPSQLYIPELDPSKVVGAEHADTWIFFPEEIEQSLKKVIEPYGYATDDDDQRPNVRSRACPIFCVNGVSFTAEGYVPRTGW